MKKHLPAKSKDHEQRIKQITDIITNIGKDKIAFVILFGSFARGTWVYDSYMEDGVYYEYASDYDILIITKLKKDASLKSVIGLKGKIKKEIAKQGLDKKPLTPSHSTNIIIESIDKVNSELKKDRYFFADIKKEGIILYDSGEFELSMPKKLSDEERKEIAKEDYDHWFKRAKGFLISHKAVFDQNMFSDAAFQLHQATESLYHCVILVLTGYKHKTHNLTELCQLCSAQSNKFLTIFPKATEEQKRCFELLEEAYIDARYNKNYTITKEQLKYLIESVELLKNIVEEVCKDRIK